MPMSEQISETAQSILVIVNDENLATAFCDSLNVNGFTALQVATGQGGLQLVQLKHPQLIVCGVELPDISGYDVLVSLRSHPKTTVLPIIMMADGQSPDTFRRCMDYGADDCLATSTNIESFLRVVRGQLAKREQLARYFINHSIESFHTKHSNVHSSQDLEKQFATVKQLPWSTLWIVRLPDYDTLQTKYGHVFGQLVIQSVKQQLHQWQGKWDTPSFSINASAYIGEGRFAIFFSGSHQPVSLYTEIIITLKADLQRPMVIHNHRFSLEIAIDTVRHTELVAAPSLEAALRGLSYCDRAINRLSLATRLRRAIERDELELYFQPQVDLASGQIVGAEALVRWVLPGKEPVLPVQFIPVAEENGLMLPMGEWVLETALKQLARWQQRQLSGISLAINVSAHQLRDAHLLERLMAIVKTANINPVMVDLELPERLIMEDLSRAKVLLTKLQNKGFSTAIDDFSSGSLSHLQYLPVNILKLDKCFVRELHCNKSNQVIVRAIMEMARGLNISTIANGVETARELSVLRQLKCQSMQGYLFSPALTVQDFEKLLSESSRRLLQQVSSC